MLAILLVDSLNVRPYRIVQDGGWVDFQVTIPDAYQQMRLRNIPAMVGNSFAHDAALWQVAFQTGGAAATPERGLYTLTPTITLTVPSFADDTGDAQNWVVGTAIASITVPAASGSPTPTYSAVSGLPNGVTFNTVTRVISGTPTSIGSGTIRIRATNSEGSDDWTVGYTTSTVLVAPTFADNTGDSQNWTTGTAIADITVPLASGNPSPIYSAISGLPSGVVFDANTRVISGTPTAVGSGTIRIRATNSEGHADWTVGYTTVAAAPTLPERGLYTLAPSLTVPVFADDTGDAQTWVQNVAITPIIVPAASGNPAPTYAVVGALPNGLFFSTSTRTISGTPTAIGSGTITIRATNSQDSDDWTVGYTTSSAPTLLERGLYTLTPSVSITVPVRPNAPSVVSTATDSITATGVAPSNGGSQITSYDWRYKKVSDSDSSWVNRDDQTNLVQTFTGLDEDTEYEVQFRATNSVGDSDYSLSGGTTTGATPSLALPMFADDTGDAQSLVCWNSYQSYDCSIG